jgi:endonuclease III-like uncharacterized protein
LKNLVGFIRDRYSGSLPKMFSSDPKELRKGPLRVSGIGPETADAILLYAAKMPFFVVDAYTKPFLAGTGSSRPLRIIRRCRGCSWTIFLPIPACIMNSTH